MQMFVLTNICLKKYCRIDIFHNDKQLYMMLAQYMCKTT